MEASFDKIDISLLLKTIACGVKTEDVVLIVEPYNVFRIIQFSQFQ